MIFYALIGDNTSLKFSDVTFFLAFLSLSCFA